MRTPLLYLLSFPLSSPLRINPSWWHPSPSIFLERIGKSVYLTTPETSQNCLCPVSELLCSLRTGILVYLLWNVWGETPFRGLIFSQLPLTCLAGICTGWSGQKRLGFYKGIWRTGTEMNNKKVEPWQGSWEEPALVQGDPDMGRSLFPAKPGNCHRYCLFLIIKSALLPGTGEVYYFPDSSLLDNCGTKWDINF